MDDEVARWAAAHPLTPAHVDCATAVMKGFKALIREQGLFDGLDVAYRDD